MGSGDSLTLGGGLSFTQGASGTFLPTVDASSGVFGITDGIDTVAGALDINTVGSPALGNTYKVINSANDVTGTFSSVSSGYSVSYSTAAVTVKVT